MFTTILQPWRHYSDFAGRSRRGEFFAFYGAFYSVLIVLALLAGVQDDRSLFDSVWGFVAIVVLIAGVLPSWAVKIRRLHDQDRSGWWSLATAIPYVGWIATIIIGLLPGTPGENEYGFDPRTAGPDAEGTFATIFHRRRSFLQIGRD